MAETIRCPVCGTSNPDSLERCRACNQSLNQSTTELNGVGERISSGQSPIKKVTSELEKALPAWLRRARNSDEDESEGKPEEVPVTEDTSSPDADADQEPIIPDFSAGDDEEENGDIDPADWLAGLENSADDEDEEEAADWLVNLQGELAPEESDLSADDSSADELIVADDSSAAGDETDLAEDADLPEWISNLQGDAAASGDDLPDLVPADDDTEISLPGEDGVPDWLSRMSEEAETASETPASEPASEPQVDATPAESGAGDLPDWMADLQSVGEVSAEGFPVPEEIRMQEPPSQPPSAEPPAESSVDEDLPDWMANLQGDEETFSTEDTGAPVPSSDDLPEWLSDGEELASEAMPAEASDEMPDWISNLQGQEEPAGQAESDDALDLLSGEDTADEVAAVVEDDGSESELPDWMTGSADEEPPAVEAAPGDLPDWMSSSEPAGETVSAEEDTDDLPDWMTGSESEEAPVTQPVSDDLPDWISGSEPSVDAAPAEPADDLPDWVASLQAGKEVPPAPLEEEAPEWLADGESETEIDEAAEPADDLPDWMAGLQEAAQATDVPQQEIAPVAETDSQEGEALVDGVGLPAEEGDTPEWLDSIPGIDDIISDEPEEEEIQEEAPAALSASPAFVDEGADEGSDDEIFGIDMPDWLSNLAPEDLAVGEGQEAEAVVATGQEEELSDAELPGWVQAMRPVASVVSDTSSGEDGEPQDVAESGPLAGLTGIIPVGVGIGPKNKPQAHSLKLRVNESQQSGAQLLERILASEAEAAPLQGEDEPVSIPLLRWIIAALMIVVIGIGLFSPQELAPSPNIAVPEIGAAVNIVNQLPVEGTVLVIFDYEAAFSAELQAAAAPLVDHLMLRGQKLVLLSSIPNGPALAERFLNETQSQHQYQLGDSYINLGYLPGGASGMLSFVAGPRAAVAGQLNGISFWDYAPLASISRIADFSAVVILTDDVEKGRAWIEQISANEDAALMPLVMAVSAQAEPIIYPYYASAQVDGLVSGLNGGATYERLQGQTGLGREYWDAYSVGLLSAEILIVLGAALNFMAGVRARKNVIEEEE